jgi:hypothetical protein
MLRPTRSHRDIETVLAHTQSEVRIFPVRACEPFVEPTKREEHIAPIGEVSGHERGLAQSGDLPFPIGWSSFPRKRYAQLTLRAARSLQTGRLKVALHPREPVGVDDHVVINEREPIGVNQARPLVARGGGSSPSTRDDRRCNSGDPGRQGQWWMITAWAVVYDHHRCRRRTF